MISLSMEKIIYREKNLFRRENQPEFFRYNSQTNSVHHYHQFLSVQITSLTEYITKDEINKTYR